MPNTTITTSILLSLLNDDEITINSLDTKFFVLTREFEELTNKDLPLTDLAYMLAEERVRTLYIRNYARWVEDDWGAEVALYDDLAIFPQGIAHIETNACTVGV